MTANKKTEELNTLQNELDLEHHDINILLQQIEQNKKLYDEKLDQLVRILKNAT